MKTITHTLYLIVLLDVSVNSFTIAQGFTSGPIPLCDTTMFTATVSGIGILYPPGTGSGYYMDMLCMDIITNHPQTYSVSLTSPMGTTLLLSAFNGSGGFFVLL